MAFLSSPRWTYRPDRRADARRLQREAGLPELAARVLANREMGDPAEAQRFLRASLSGMRDPFELPDTDRAAARVARAITRNEKITIYGDYDVDGICATSLLIELFDFMGVEAGYYIPHRVEEGYGLRREAIDKLAARGTQLLITVDNGISAFDEIAYANSLGIDVIVTDHHEAGKRLPQACAVIDPKRVDRPYIHADFSGTGVAWKLAHCILRETGIEPEKGRGFLMSQLDLVALATVADVVPLVGENRLLARAGIEAIGKTERPGLRALMDVSGVNGAVTTRAIGFQIAPRLNAVGRTRSAMLGVRLLTSREAEGARKIAEELDALNVGRRAEEKTIFEQAVAECEKLGEELTRKVIVVAREGWTPGLVGLIASRLTELRYRPSFVINIDRARNLAKGSARSIPGFNLYEALQSYFHSADQFGGHAMAAGFTVRADEIDAFREAMIAFANAALPDDRLRPEILIDAEMPLTGLTLEAAEAVAMLEPFGEGNPRPLISFSDVSLADQPRIVGANHLKLRLCQSGTYISAIGFGMGEFDSRLLRHRGSFCVAGYPTVNDYQDRRSPEIELVDIRFE